MPGLHHTGLTVRDLDRSLAFYEGVLGMEPVMEVQKRRGGYWGAIVGYEDVDVRFVHLAFAGSGHRLELVEYRNPPARGDAGEPRDVGVTHVCFLVPDLDEVAGRLGAGGGEAYSKPVTSIPASCCKPLL